MDKERFETFVRRLRPGDLIEIVQTDPSGVGFFTDPATEKKLDIRRPHYFAGRTSISPEEPGISVTSNKEEISGRPEASYAPISYKDILNIELVKRHIP